MSMQIGRWDQRPRDQNEAGTEVGSRRKERWSTRELLMVRFCGVLVLTRVSIDGAERNFLSASYVWIRMAFGWSRYGLTPLDLMPQDNLLLNSIRARVGVALVCVLL